MVSVAIVTGRRSPCLLFDCKVNTLAVNYINVEGSCQFQLLI